MAQAKRFTVPKKSPSSGVFPVSEKTSKEKDELEAIERDINALRHNAKNPLTTVLYSVDLLECLVDMNNPEIKEAIEATKNAINTIKNVLNSPIPSLEKALDRLPIRFEPVNIQTLTEKIKKEYSSRAEINVTVLGKRSTALGDKQHLKQVFDNLVDNAIKFNDQETKIVEIVIVDMEQRLHIVVRDNGPGVREEEKEKIFQEQYRSEQTSHIDGEGLGLNYVQNVITEMGGEIYLECSNSGGAVFTIVLNSTFQEPRPDRT